MKNNIRNVQNLPYDFDIERAVIGAAFLNREAADKIADLEPEFFYDERLGRVASIIKVMRQQSKPVDILTVKDEIRSSEGKAKEISITVLTECMDMVVSDANLEVHCQILHSLWARRKLIQHFKFQCEELQSNGDVLEAIETSDKLHTKIISYRTLRTQRSMDEIALSFMEELENRYTNPETITGVPSGIEVLDNVTGGWENGKVWIIAARPSMGKTDNAINFALGAAKFGYKPVILSLEMDEVTLFRRAVSIVSGLSKGSLKKGIQYEIDEYGGLGKIMDLASRLARKIKIMDLGNTDIWGIKRKCRQAVKEGCNLIIIDYMGLIDTNDGTRRPLVQILGEISRIIKMSIAKDLNIPVVALHQLNRAVEQRGGEKRPMLSDLRDSGNIEQDADGVIFLYRPEYYNIQEDANGNSTHGLLEYIVPKNREGKTGTVLAHYSPETGIIKRWEEEGYRYSR